MDLHAERYLNMTHVMLVMTYVMGTMEEHLLEKTFFLFSLQMNSNSDDQAAVAYMLSRAVPFDPPLPLNPFEPFDPARRPPIPKRPFVLCLI
jgi:hypothetical protein